MDAFSVGSVVRSNEDSQSYRMPLTDSRPYRILLMDHIEVLYDVYWSPTIGWGFSNLDGEGHYYHIPPDILRSRSTVLRAEPLTDVERAVHRPDLPLRLLRSPSMQWSKNQYQGMAHFIAIHQAEIEQLGISGDDVALDARQVFLAPFAPDGGQKRSVKIEALNEKNFSSIELLWRACEIQAPHLRKSTNGVGIYRAGFKRRLPVFYLWGSYDKAGFISRAEGLATPQPQEKAYADRPRRLRDVQEMTYDDRLGSWRNNFPISEWRTGLQHGLEQYTEANCDRAERILNDLVDGLIDVGEAASEAKKIDLFKTAVEALNALDAETGMIETGEREELCELFNLIAVEAGIDPSKYGNGEGPASEWRNW